MRSLFDFSLFCLIAILILENQLLLALVGVAWFTWRNGAGWLIVLAVCIDGYFGAFYKIPVFSLCAGAWFFITEFFRPKLLLYTKL